MVVTAISGLLFFLFAVAVLAWAVSAFNYAIYRWKHFRAQANGPRAALVWPLWIAAPGTVPNAEENRRIIVRATQVFVGVCATAIALGVAMEAIQPHP